MNQSNQFDEAKIINEVAGFYNSNQTDEINVIESMVDSTMKIIIATIKPYISDKNKIDEYDQASNLKNKYEKFVNICDNFPLTFKIEEYHQFKTLKCVSEMLAKLEPFSKSDDNNNIFMSIINKSLELRIKLMNITETYVDKRMSEFTGQQQIKDKCNELLDNMEKNKPLLFSEIKEIRNEAINIISESYFLFFRLNSRIDTMVDSDRTLFLSKANEIISMIAENNNNNNNNYNYNYKNHDCNYKYMR